MREGGKEEKNRRDKESRGKSTIPLPRHEKKKPAIGFRRMERTIVERNQCTGFSPEKTTERGVRGKGKPVKIRGKLNRG